MTEKEIIEKLQGVRKNVEALIKVDNYAKHIRKQRVLETIDEIITYLNQ